MVELIKKIVGTSNYIRLEHFKKQLLPTKYDKVQELLLAEQVQFYLNIIKPGSLCFDIGGNIGVKTNVFLRLAAKVVVLEPQIDCVEILKIKYGKRATILQKGAGSKNEVKEFYVSNNSQLSSFSKDWLGQLKDGRFQGNNIQKIEKIELVTLDSLINAYGYPDFIKIDVEGYEIEVLKGLSKSFGMLSFEYAVPEKLEEVLKCLEYLNNTFSNLKCNYACGNHYTSFQFKDWLSISEIINHVQTKEFEDTFTGDIYIRMT